MTPTCLGITRPLSLDQLYMWTQCIASPPLAGEAKGSLMTTTIGFLSTHFTKISLTSTPQRHEALTLHQPIVVRDNEAGHALSPQPQTAGVAWDM